MSEQVLKIENVTMQFGGVVAVPKAHLPKSIIAALLHWFSTEQDLN